MRVECLENFENFNEVKDHVHKRLCELEQLEMNSFPLSLQLLKRGATACGYIFSISGPRSVLFNAILETEKNSIHYYNSSGERVVSESLKSSPPLS